jgi:N-methylhydantoinase A
VEFVNLRTVHVHQVAARTTGDPAHSTSREPFPVAHREAYFDERNGYVRTPIYDRRSMTGGTTIAGPAIVEQPDTTVIVHPGQRATMRPDRSLLIEVAHAN